MLVTENNLLAARAVAANASQRYPDTYTLYYEFNKKR